MVTGQLIVTVTKNLLTNIVRMYYSSETKVMIFIIIIIMMISINKLRPEVMPSNMFEF